MNKVPHIELNWISPAEVQVPEDFRKRLYAPEIVLQTLIRRGLKDYDSAIRFIDLTRYIPAPASDLPDLDKGVQRLAEAVHSGSTIGVWGDFDVDGQTATSVLVSALRQIGANVKYHIPLRATESHGIKLDALKDFLDEGVNVLLTCDTGITAHESISYAQSRGVDVVVTDHHLLPAILPPAYALINPRRLEPDHPLAALPGVGVAFKFAESLLSQFGAADYSTSLHDLVALGAIADLADLLGDTRFLVQSGLSNIRKSPRPALQAMLQAAEIDREHFTEEHISYAIAPRLNAVGRLADANPMVEFLLSEDSGHIAATVTRLEELNAQRKILCDQVFNGALACLERDRSILDQPLLILDHPEWPAGVVGIVASRLVEMFHRPVILLVAPPNQPMKGSARSVEGIDITAALTQNQKLLLSFGGHPMAAGMSLSPENYSAFKRGMGRSVAYQASTRQVSQDLVIDGWVSPAAFSLELLKSFDWLAPFGPGNPPLLFAARSLSLVDTTPVGKMKEHLQVTVEDTGGSQTKLIWWNTSRLPLPDGKFDLAYTVHSSNYRGQEGVQFEWADFRRIDDSLPVIVRPQRKLIQNHDHRRSGQPQIDLRRIENEPGTVVWREGTYETAIAGVDRDHLRPSASLVIWSTPPSPLVLQGILTTVKPGHIHWFLQPPLEHQLANFTRTLARNVKNSLDTGKQEFGLEPIAAQTGLSMQIVETGLKWLESEGHITLAKISPNTMEIKPGGKKDEQTSQILRQSLLKLFEELNSYSAFLHRVDLDSLTQDLG